VGSEMCIRDRKGKTFYGKQMYEKTKSLIDNWN